MSLSDVRAQLEYEITWRRNELRHLGNNLMQSRDQMERRRFRRPMVLLLYAHYEGFCQVALRVYLGCINRQQLTCQEVVPAVRAGSWTPVFRALENTDRKCEIFRRDLPEDSQLHRFARRMDFAMQIEEFFGEQVCIPDDAVDTESNLWPVVLRKNLFRLGLDYESFAEYDGDIKHLLNRRNNIAHGLDTDGMDEADYLRLEQAVFSIMDHLTELVIDSLEEERFRQSEELNQTFLANI